MSIVPATTASTFPYQTVAKLNVQKNIDGAPANAESSGILISPNWILTAQHNFQDAILDSGNIIGGANFSGSVSTRFKEIVNIRGDLTTKDAFEGSDISLVSMKEDGRVDPNASPVESIMGMVFFADSRDRMGQTWTHAGYPDFGINLEMHQVVRPTYAFNPDGQANTFSLSSTFRGAALDVSEGQSGGGAWLEYAGDKFVGGVLSFNEGGIFYKTVNFIGLSMSDHNAIMGRLAENEVNYSADDLPRNLIYGSKAGGTAFANLDGSYRRDIIIGGAGAENINGGYGKDKIYGGNDKDVLSGGLGVGLALEDLESDYLDGQSGADIYYIGQDDVINDTGVDKAVDAYNIFSTSTTVTSFDDADGKWTVNYLTGQQQRLAQGVETVNTSAANTVSLLELLQNGQGNGSFDETGRITVSLSAGGRLAVSNFNWDDGSIRLDVGREAKSIVGTTRNDELDGTRKADILLGDAGDDRIDGKAGNDEISGGDGNDNLKGGDGNDKLYGDRGDDKLDGGDGNDMLWGGSGSDGLKGGDGNDILSGNQGDDKLSGGDGRDRLLGGSGADIESGGEGRDTFVFH
jgi:Ca2+-binding RTX toxin-like protein